MRQAKTSLKQYADSKLLKISKSQAIEIIEDGMQLWCTCDHPESSEGSHVLGCLYMDAVLLLKKKRRF